METVGDKTATSAVVSIEKFEKHGIDHGNEDSTLKTTTDGIILVPQPTDDPEEPLVSSTLSEHNAKANKLAENWGFAKKHTALLILALLTFFVKFTATLIVRVSSRSHQYHRNFRSNMLGPRRPRACRRFSHHPNAGNIYHDRIIYHAVHRALRLGPTLLPSRPPTYPLDRQSACYSICYWRRAFAELRPGARVSRVHGIQCVRWYLYRPGRHLRYVLPARAREAYGF
jgi:hypothetical protein